MAKPRGEIRKRDRKGEYLNCPPPIFFKISGLQEGGMGRYSSHGIKGFVIPTKLFVKIGIAKTFCYNNKMFSSINKTFGCCSKIFGWSNKKFICGP